MFIVLVVGFVGMLVVIIFFVIEFVGDYFVVVWLFNVEVLLLYVVNCGIVIEGFVSIILGMVGVGYFIILYSGNIGVIGIIKVGGLEIFL